MQIVVLTKVSGVVSAHVPLEAPQIFIKRQMCFSDVFYAKSKYAFLHNISRH